MKIYTKQGDSGTTSLIGGEKVSKYDPRVEAYGTVDELSAHIALLTDMLAGRDVDGVVEDLHRTASVLMSVEAVLAVGKGGEGMIADLDSRDVEYLEKRIDELSSVLQPFRGFTLPGGDTAVSEAHVCRTVCRRAERRAFEAAGDNDRAVNALRYLNRLSDYLYTVTRWLAYRWEMKEILWER